MENRKKTEAKKAKTHTDNILELKNITKTFLGGKIVANDNVSIDFKRNEVHALVGENGSGKSTLMNILFGLYKQDKGEIIINGEKVDMYQAGAAKHFKIGMVHQHFHLVDEFSVLENVILGQERASVNEEEIEQMKKSLSSLNEEIDSLVKDKKLEEVYYELNDLLKDKNKEKYYIKKNKNLHRVYEKKQQKLNPGKQDKKIERYQKEIDRRSEWVAYHSKVVEILRNKESKLASKNKDNKKLFELLKNRLIIERDIEANDLVGRFGILKRNNLLNRFIKIQQKYNISLDPFAKVSTLAVGQRQMVEILKVLWEEKDIIVLDEPTATLSVVEIEALLKTIKSLQEEGKTIIFISHKLQEVKEIANRISVLRKGVLMGVYKNDSKLKPADIGKLMVGKTIKLDYPKRKINGKNTLEVKNITYRTKSGFKALDNISFQVKEGEIFGLAGIEGNGQEEVVKILTDLRKPREGEIFFKGKLLTDKSGYKYNGLQRRNFESHVPIDRLQYGVVPAMDLEFNAKLTDFDTDFLTAGKKKISKVELAKFTDEIIKGMKVDGAFNHQVELRNLSGGNQQKFVVGRELYRKHELFIAGHPTRGLDISAIDNIYRQMIKNSKGKTTILYSLEISELIAVCDRMAIFYKGKIVDIVNPKEVSLEKISRMMIGEAS